MKLHELNFENYGPKATFLKGPEMWIAQERIAAVRHLGYAPEHALINIAPNLWFEVWESYDEVMAVMLEFRT